MPINPVQFAHGVCDEFLRYLFSAFPLSDPELAEQARKLLERPSSLDIPLVQGPFVSLSEAFAKGESVQKLADQGMLHHVMPGLIGYPTMWQHQQQVFEAVKTGQPCAGRHRHRVGQDRSVPLPHRGRPAAAARQGHHVGADGDPHLPHERPGQRPVDRLRDMLGGTGITFGQWVGTTPDNGKRCHDGPLSRVRSRQAYLAARQKRREEAQAEDRAVRPLAPPEECCSEEDIRERKPRILLTNYRQLEVLTTRLPDVALFAEAPLKYLVFDEAHTYSGATGAEVACLVRRVRALAGKKPDEIICIGTSATLSDPAKKDQDNDETARRFASRFFGVDAEQGHAGRRVLRQPGMAAASLRPSLPHGDGMDRLEPGAGGGHRAGRTSPTIKAVVEELTGQIFDPGENWRESLFDHLVTNEYVFQSYASPAEAQAAGGGGLGRPRNGWRWVGWPRATRPTPNCWPIWCWGRRPRRAASRCCGPRSTSSCGAWTRWWSPSAAPTRPPKAEPLPVAERRQGAARRSPRRRLLPGADVPKLRPALLREVRTRTWNSPRGRRTSFGASSTATPPRTTTARITPSGPPPPSGTAPGWS